MDLLAKEQKLTQIISSLGSVIIAYSGGVDSSLLAYYARSILKGNARVVIAVSPSLAQEELFSAQQQAEQFGWDLIEIATNEVENPDYKRNDAMRCYVCKKTLFEELHSMAEQCAIPYVAYGANVDDLQDFRPGHKAAREYKILSPLQEAGLIKEEIRMLAKQAALPSWNRPQAACLSSRFPTFETVTIEKLHQVEQGEAYLHGLGFRQVRVRHHGDLARIEIANEEMTKLSANLALMHEVSAELKKLGYLYVTLDTSGYQQGSSNRMNNLPKTADTK